MDERLRTTEDRFPKISKEKIFDVRRESNAEKVEFVLKVRKLMEEKDPILLDFLSEYYIKNNEPVEFLLGITTVWILLDGLGLPSLSEVTLADFLKELKEKGGLADALERVEENPFLIVTIVGQEGVIDSEGHLKPFTKGAMLTYELTRFQWKQSKSEPASLA